LEINIFITENIKNKIFMLSRQYSWINFPSNSFDRYEKLIISILLISIICRDFDPETNLMCAEFKAILTITLGKKKHRGLYFQKLQICALFCYVTEEILKENASKVKSCGCYPIRSIQSYILFETHRSDGENHMWKLKNE